MRVFKETHIRFYLQSFSLYCSISLFLNILGKVFLKNLVKTMSRKNYVTTLGDNEGQHSLALVRSAASSSSGVSIPVAHSLAYPSVAHLLTITTNLVTNLSSTF